MHGVMHNAQCVKTLHLWTVIHATTVWVSTSVLILLAQWICTHHGEWTQWLYHRPQSMCVSAETARVPHGNGVFIPFELIVGCDSDFFASCQLDGLIRIFEEASSDFRPLKSKDMV